MKQLEETINFSRCRTFQTSVRLRTLRVWQPPISTIKEHTRHLISVSHHRLAIISYQQVWATLVELWQSVLPPQWVRCRGIRINRGDRSLVSRQIIIVCIQFLEEATSREDHLHEESAGNPGELFCQDQIPRHFYERRHGSQDTATRKPCTSLVQKPQSKS